jgi:hypothetical protein
MLAAVPGSYLAAPVAMILIALGTIGISLETVIPIGVAVVTAHITVSLFQVFVVQKRKIESEEAK